MASRAGGQEKKMRADGTETLGEAFKALTLPVVILTDWRLLWACVTQVIIAALIGFAIHTVTTLDVPAYIIGATIWTIILCFTPAVNIWFIQPLGNHAVVLQHALRRKEKVTDPNQAIKLRPTKAYRVIYGPALTGKSMFESVLGNEVIDLRRSIGLKNDEIKVSTGDGANHILKYWTSCSPIQTDECLINLARHTESAVVEYFSRSFTGYLQRTANALPTTDALIDAMSDEDANGQPGHLRHGFNNHFKGKDVADDREIERGMGTGDPQCELILDPKFQKARQAIPTAALKRLAIKEYTDGQNGVHPDIAANMVATDVGDEMPAKVNKFVVETPHGAGTRDVIIALDGRNNQR